MKSAASFAIAAALVGLQASASAETFSAVSGTGFTTETTSLANQYLMPLAPTGSSVTSYSVLSTAAGFSSVGTISFATPVTSYTFLWGSPDTFNSVSDGTKTVSLGGSGNNALSQLYTFTSTAFSTLTFTTTGIAFEIAAVTPVPEPETYALLLGGLGAVFTIARRRRV